MEFTARKDQVENELKRFLKFNKKDSIVHACAIYVLLKMKMQKIGHENLSLHTPLIISFLSNFIYFNNLNVLMDFGFDPFT